VFEFPETESPELPKTFKVVLGDVISRDPAAVGRSTVVVKATSDRWKGTNLVVKISWPGAGRVPETKFLEKAIEEARKTEGEWAVKHLPRVFYARDLSFSEDSTFKSVERLFKDAKFAEPERDYVYERRELRIIIQEELYPLKSLTNAKDIGQVFVDIACIHRWLHDNPGILHRDLSLNNIMWRFIVEMSAEEKPETRIYGVLTDYDLSSWTEDLKSDYTRPSQQRTGTPPYMAQELLKGTSLTHLYRHDVESLFYVILLTCGRHTFGVTKKQRLPVIMRVGLRPYEEWFGNQNYSVLGKVKASFFSDMEAIELSPPFHDFRPWLLTLQSRFSRGFSTKAIHIINLQECEDSAEELVPFDNETLGGYILSSSFIEPVPRLTGELEGLIVRYDPPPSLLPASVGATYADA